LGRRVSDHLIDDSYILRAEVYQTLTYKKRMGGLIPGRPRRCRAGSRGHRVTQKRVEGGALVLLRSLSFLGDHSVHREVQRLGSGG